MFKEFSDSIKASIYERSSSPLFGAYAGIWSVCNWKLISYFALANDPITKKIQFIEGNYIDSWINFYLPLIVTFVFLIVYPILSIGAYYIWEKVSTIKANLRFTLGAVVPLSIEESFQMRNDTRLKQQEFKKEIDEYKENLNKQKEIQTELRNQLIELRKQSNDKSSLKRAEKNEYFSNVSDPHTTVKECDDYVIKYINKMDQNDKATFREMLPEEVWGSIPRRTWKNINSVFHSLVTDGTFPEIKHAANAEHNEPIYMRL